MDLLPDILGLVGRIDDIIVVFFLYWRYQALLKQFRAKFTKHNLEQEKSQNQSKNQQESKPQTPYEVLGVKQNANKKEIQKAYKELVKLYHPDLVNHLGPELQELANKKMKAIQNAYEELIK